MAFPIHKIAFNESLITAFMGGDLHRQHKICLEMQVRLEVGEAKEFVAINPEGSSK